MKRIGTVTVIRAMVNNINSFYCGLTKREGSVHRWWRLGESWLVDPLETRGYCSYQTFLRLDNLNKTFPPLKVEQLCAIIIFYSNQHLIVLNFVGTSLNINIVYNSLTLLQCFPFFMLIIGKFERVRNTENHKWVKVFW